MEFSSFKNHFLYTVWSVYLIPIFTSPLPRRPLIVEYPLYHGKHWLYHWLLTLQVLPEAHAVAPVQP